MNNKKNTREIMKTKDTERQGLPSCSSLARLALCLLTRNRGYRKKGKDMKIPHFIYKKYPRLRVVLSKRCRIYNEQLDLVERCV